MTKYLHVIPGKDFHILDNESVKIAKKASGKIPQHGIRYVDDETIVLQSNNPHDVLDAVRNGGWAHSTNPSRVKSGWTIIIVPSDPVEGLYGKGAIGVKFTATEDVFEDKNNSFVWASE